MKNLKPYTEFIFESTGNPTADSNIQFALQDMLDKVKDSKATLASSPDGEEFWNNSTPAAEGMIQGIGGLIPYLKKIKDEGNLKISDDTMKDLEMIARLHWEDAPYGQINRKLEDALTQALEDYRNKSALDAKIGQIFK
jgi:hypothetical protein